MKSLLGEAMDKIDLELKFTGNLCSVSQF